MLRPNIDPKGPQQVSASGSKVEKDIIETRIQFFQQIADPVRHSILDLLSKENEISDTR